MSNDDPRGQFVWHELLTTDAAAATNFYTRVVPWKTQAWEADPSYSMWVGRNGLVGGLSSLGESGEPHWVPYIAVSDVTTAIEAAQHLGGRVVEEPKTLSNGGVHALLADPQGAQFGIYSSNEKPDGAGGPAPGDFSWHELATSDPEAAMEFYTKLFGWEAGPTHDMGPEGLYRIFLRNGQQYGGIYASQDGAPNWLCYVAVEDAGKAVEAVKAAGGRVINGPMEVPGGSWVAQVMDHEGAAFAVHEPKMESAQEEQPAEKPAKPAKTRAPKRAKPEAAPEESASAAASGGADETAVSVDEPAPSEAPAKKRAWKKKTSSDEAPAATEVPAASEAEKASEARTARRASTRGKAAGKKAAAKKSRTKKSARPAAAARAGAKRGAKKSAAKKPAAKSAARKSAARKPAKKVARKSAAKAKGKTSRAATKKAAPKSSAARRAPARKKASRGKAKKRR